MSLKDRQQFQIVKELIDGPKTFWEIVSEVDGTIMDLFSNLKHLESEGKLFYRENQFNLKPRVKYNGEFSPDFSSALITFEKIAEERPESKLEYFQGSILSKDIFKRIEFMYDRGDLLGKDILILGDDDLLSIAVGLLGLANRILVMEIDLRIIKCIKEISNRYDLNIEVIQHNCAEPIPEQLLGKFDTALMDPVETEKGFTAFVSRIVMTLKHPGSLYFGLSEIECPAKIWSLIQKNLLKMNFIFTDIKRKFSGYPEEKEENQKYYESLKLWKVSPYNLKIPNNTWYKSGFIRAITIDSPSQIIKGKIDFDSSFYENDYVLTTK